MKICVLNGSPKGRDSVTMQYVRFLECAFYNHSFVIEDVGQYIRTIESKETEFKRVIGSVASSDAVLFATPVYYMLVPSQFKRFFELVFSRNAQGAFSGKYAASITTSIHFFDHTANAYLHAVAEDLQMHWAGTFAAKMEDLLLVEYQEKLAGFGSDLFDTIARKPPVQRWYPPVSARTVLYRPGPVPVPFDTGGKRVAVLSDAAPGSNLEKMVTRLAACFGKAAEVSGIDDARMTGGCLGCCRCAFDNTCVYTDGFSSFWKEKILAADILILAGTVKDRYLSAEFKQLFDRTFFMGHVSGMAGKQVGILVEGPLFQLSTLREILTAYPVMQGANLAGIVTDEEGDSAAIDARIDALAERCIRLSGAGYVAPETFLSVGGRKIFRDEIWGGMRAVFKADHRYYKAHGVYDFPQYDTAKRVRTALLSFFLDLPPVKKEAVQNMKKHMIQPFEKVFSDSPVLKKRREEAGHAGNGSSG
jgi:multimeric flavodoxin WrbA